MLYEQEIMGIIMNAGDASRCAFEALDFIEGSDYAAARSALKNGRQYMVKAHQVQTQLISDECNEQHEAKNVPLMMVHAQDHLMNAVLLLDLVERMNMIFERHEVCA